MRLLSTTRCALALALSLALIAVSGLPAYAAPSLTMPVDYAVGPEPWDVTVALLDGDSFLDIATANRGDDTVTVRYGNGFGGFGEAVHYDVGSDPWAVAAADFDDDGFMDLAVANYEDDTISLLRGGAAGFETSVPHALGGSGTPVALAVAKFNGDDYPDLAVADTATNSVAILLSAGDGSFGIPTYLNVSTYPISLATGDFNGDLHQDIAVACSNADVVSVLLGNGDGTFGDAVDYPVGDNPVSVTVGMFDGDGTLDMAVANSGGDDSVSILLGVGDGTFNAGTDIDMGIGAIPADIAVGMFDEGVNIDLAVANHGTESVSILAGDGAGGFESIGDFAVGLNPVALGTGDFDSDLRSDVVVVNYGADSVSIMLSKELDELAIELVAGWNMVSVPLTLPDMSVGAVFPAAVAVYSWNPDSKSYSQPGTIETERAYWVAVAEASTLNLRGDAEPVLQVGLSAGWNMVGSVYGASVAVGDLVDVEPGTVLRSAIYHWNPGSKSYAAVSFIDPGLGYWVATTAGCTLTIGGD